MHSFYKDYFTSTILYTHQKAQDKHQMDAHWHVNHKFYYQSLIKVYPYAMFLDIQPHYNLDTTPIEIPKFSQNSPHGCTLSTTTTSGAQSCIHTKKLKTKIKWTHIGM